MTIQDFKSFSFDKKCEVVTIHSDYLSYRNEKNITSYLYHTGAFFIEVTYCSGSKKIIGINAFNDFCRLCFYAESISLADLNLFSKSG